MKYICYLFFACILFSCSNEKKSPVDYVNPFIGTGFHGHTYPGATVPFGAVQLSPDTRKGDWDACSGYHYSDSTLMGFSHTHLSGTGCIDLGDVLFYPSIRTLNGDTIEPFEFSHAAETASPGYYSVELKKEKMKAELTATRYAGMHRYTFPKNEKAFIYIDLNHSLSEDQKVYESKIEATAENELTGMRRTGAWVDNRHIYFVAQFSKPFHPLESRTGNLVPLTFDVSDGEPLVARIAFSIVSIENARENLKHDIPDFDFDAVRKKARESWEEALSDIVVSGGTEAELTNFYTAAYHTKVVPNIISDVNGEYRNPNDSIAKTPQGEKRYSTFSLWDTFRAWNPLMALTDTTLVCDMICSYLDFYDATGELPIWPLSSGETGTMIGYHSVSVITDAYMKGIRGFDAEKALEAMKVSSGKNRKGTGYYIQYGYIPSDIKKESISCLLEYAYDDWCIAQFAKALGKEEDYNCYIQRSQSFIHVFDGAVKFFRGKRLDGNWETPFNPVEPGRDYTEATAWQYRFFAPHDVNGMIQLFGGQDAFTRALDDLFTVDSKIDGHLSDITGLIGQYAHGNEPSHHMAYLYNYVGQPWKTQAMVRRILHEMYQPAPEGICGNEDCGQMSAWYMLSSLGLYAVCPGSNEWILTSPLFEKAEIRLANGKTLTILSNDPSKNVYIEKVELNGKPVKTSYITNDQLMEGGELRFTLSAVPNEKWGASPAAFPYSYTKEPVVSIPYVDKDLSLFDGEVDVKLGSATGGASIRYTTDGSEPDEKSPEYKEPFKINTTTPIKAKGFKPGFQPSRTMSVTATRMELLPPVTDRSTGQGVNYRYYEGLYREIADIEKSKLLDSGKMPEPSIKNAPQPDHFAFVFSGLINVPEDGIYKFQTRSDDGSVLYIGKNRVVDNDGSHGAIAATGRIALKKGYHPYSLYYFEDYEGELLEWKWKKPSDTNMVAIPLENLYLK